MLFIVDEHLAIQLINSYVTQIGKQMIKRAKVFDLMFKTRSGYPVGIKLLQ